jgi:MazG family protein
MTDLARLLAIMARLRDPERGCPWDVEQTFATIAPYTIEEAYEVDDAIRREDLAALCEELGDLLLQVVFHARMAEEEGAFAFADVVDGLCAKLERRHPHVFGDAVIESARAQTEAWEVTKAAERAAAAKRRSATEPPASALDDLPLALPALLRAQKLARRARRTSAEPVGALDAGARFAAAAGREALDALEALARSSDAEPRDEVRRANIAATAMGGVDAETALREATARREDGLRARERAR